MDNPTIHAELRTSVGKGVARKLRRAGRMPAVAYGATGGAVPLTVDPQEIEELKKSPLGWNQPVQIEIDGGDSVALAMLKAVDKHLISGALLHADFMRLDAKEKILVNVPLRIEGTAPGVAMGGLLNRQLRTLAVHCLPADIPAGIAVDVSSLEVGDRLLLSELKLPAGVVSSIEDTLVVNVVGRRGARLDEDDLDAELEGGEEAAEGGETANKESGK
jgi:large subunit ribosomal protein L25